MTVHSKEKAVAIVAAALRADFARRNIVWGDAAESVATGDPTEALAVAIVDALITEGYMKSEKKE